MIHYISPVIATCGLGLGITISICLFLILNDSHKKRVAKNLDLDSSTSFVYSGNLKQTTLVEAAQFLELGKRNGVLHIYSGRRKGHISFNDGKIIDAFYRNLDGKEAMIQMFDIDEGDFYFEPKLITHPRVINESIINLAFEWDEQKHRDDTDPLTAIDERGSLDKE